jgi:RNA recognition motif-containing protein
LLQQREIALTRAGKKHLMTNIFVGNLSYQTTEANLRQAFERYGKVARVRIITDRQTGRSRGFGFVEMPRLDDADEAIHHLHNSSFCGRTLAVNEASSTPASLRVTPRPHRAWIAFDAL